MGREITVFSSTSKILDTNGLTASNNTVAAACFKGEYPLNSKLLDSMTSSIATSIHQIYRYGRDTYTYGLPNGYSVNVASINIPLIKSIITEEVGYEIDIEHAYLGLPSDAFFSQAHATKYWGFYFEKGYMVNAPVKTSGIRYSELMGANLRADGSLVHTMSVRISNTGFGKKVITKDVTTTRANTRFQPDGSKFTYQIRFKPKDSVNVNHDYWAYEVGKGIHPILDDISIESNSAFLPIVPLREYNKNLGPEIDSEGEFKLDAEGNKIVPDTELYRTSKRLLNIAGLRMDDLCKGISTNPDVGDIDNAYVAFAIDLRTKSKEGKNYLYQFFKALSANYPYEGVIEIKDASYKINLTFSAISLTTKTGSFLPVVVPTNRPFSYKQHTTELTYTDEDIIIKRMITDNSYEEIIVKELKHVNYIYQGHAQTTTVEGSKETNSGFLIPLQYDLITTGRGLFARQDLIKESMVLVFNCTDSRKLKWYESGFFKLIMVIIAVVIIYFSGGTLAAPLMQAYAAGVQALAIYIATTAVYAYAVDYAIAYLVKEHGAEWGAVAAVLNVIISVYLPTTAVGGKSLISSSSLLAATSGIANSISTITSALLEGLEVEMEDFKKTSNEADLELQEMMDELIDNNWMNADIITGRSMVEYLNEKPEDFYNRTIHSGNIGTTIYSVIPNYVANMTKLPTLDDIIKQQQKEE